LYETLRTRTYPAGSVSAELQERLQDEDKVKDQFGREELIAIVCRLLPNYDWKEFLRGYKVEDIRAFIRLVVFDPDEDSACLSGRPARPIPLGDRATSPVRRLQEDVRATYPRRVRMGMMAGAGAGAGAGARAD
jgi:hypothetical protein